MPLEPTKGSITLDYAKKVAPGALAEDVEGDTILTTTTPNSGTYYTQNWNTWSEVGEEVLLTKNLTFDASSLAFAVAFYSGDAVYADTLKLRLYMGGTLMQESAFLPARPHSLNFVLRDFKALSGSQDCELRGYNEYDGINRIDGYGGDSTSQCPAAIAVGSVKLV